MYITIYYLSEIRSGFALVMCRVSPKIATLEVQDQDHETAICRTFTFTFTFTLKSSRCTLAL